MKVLSFKDINRSLYLKCVCFSSCLKQCCRYGTLLSVSYWYIEVNSHYAFYCVVERNMMWKLCWHSCNETVWWIRGRMKEV